MDNLTSPDPTRPEPLMQCVFVVISIVVAKQCAKLERCRM